jgi:hypothetical protein
MAGQIAPDFFIGRVAAWRGFTAFLSAISGAGTDRRASLRFR